MPTAAAADLGSNCMNTDVLGHHLAAMLGATLKNGYQVHNECWQIS
jgi:hypothetical protein